MIYILTILQHSILYSNYICDIYVYYKYVIIYYLLNIIIYGCIHNVWLLLYQTVLLSINITQIYYIVICNSITL